MNSSSLPATRDVDRGALNKKAPQYWCQFDDLLCMAGPFPRRTRFDGHTLCDDSLFNSSSRVAACDFRTQFRQIAADVSTMWRSNIALAGSSPSINAQHQCHLLLACAQQTQENIVIQIVYGKSVAILLSFEACCKNYIVLHTMNLLAKMLLKN